MSEFSKKCSNATCENVQTYTTKKHLNRAIKFNKRCRSCACKEAHVGKTNEEYYGGPEKNKQRLEKLSISKTGKKRPPFSEEWKLNLSLARQNNQKLNDWCQSFEFRRLMHIQAIEQHHPGITYEEWKTLVSERELYYVEVGFHTKSQPIHLLENYEKRGKAGIVGAYHLDHIVPISYGFKHQIPPEDIGNISNLRFITWEENTSKGGKYEGNCENLRKTDNNNTRNP